MKFYLIKTSSDRRYSLKLADIGHCLFFCVLFDGELDTVLVLQTLNMEIRPQPSRR